MSGHFVVRRQRNRELRGTLSWRRKRPENSRIEGHTTSHSKFDSNVPPWLRPNFATLWNKRGTRGSLEWAPHIPLMFSNYLLINRLASEME